jgi:hypothetical protein
MLEAPRASKRFAAIAFAQDHAPAPVGADARFEPAGGRSPSTGRIRGLRRPATRRRSTAWPRVSTSSAALVSRAWTSSDTIGADELFWRGVLDPRDRALDQVLVGQPD